LTFGLDTFVNPFSILGDKFTLEGQQDAYIQEQLDAYRDGGTFVYGEDGKTVIGVAKPNYDADGDGENDTVILNNANNDFSSGDDDIIVSGDGISITDVNTNNDVDGDSEEYDIDVVESNTTYTNTEDGVVETNVGGTDTQTGGDDNPCPDGYMLIDGICQPIDGVGTEEGDEAAARVNLSLRKITRGGGDTTGTTPTPVVGDPLTIRAPKQFFEGGGVYGPDAEDEDYDRYYVRNNVVYTDYGPGYSTYQIGEGEDPSAIINFLDQQGFRETAPADSMDDGSAFLGFGGNQTTQGQQSQVSYMDDLIDSQKPEPVIEPMIIRAPKQFAMGGPVDLDPNTYDFRGFDTDNPFDLSSILAMQKHEQGLKPFDDSQMQLYDLNRDGIVDNTDVTAGLKYINYSPDGVFDEQRANAEDFYLYSPKISLGSRPQRDLSTTNPVQQPVQQPVQGMAIRQPKQFAAGGMVTPNIDRFLQSLGA